MKFKNSIVFVLIAGAFAIAAACSRGPVFTAGIGIKDQVWKRFDRLIFTIPVEKPNQPVDITLTAVTTDQFAYTGLPVYVILTTPSGEERMREVTLPVSSGNQPEKPADSLHHAKIVLWKSVNLSGSGKCVVTVENLIPKFETAGVHRIGLELTKSEE